MSVEDKIKKLIAEQCRVDIEKVVEEAHLIDDLGADSLDIVELTMALEEKFSVSISDEYSEKLVTVTACLEYAKEHDFT